MPYKSTTELPEAAKGLPEHAKQIYMDAFNSAWGQHLGDEATCSAIAWAAVKAKYRKEGDAWVAVPEARQAGDELGLRYFTPFALAEGSARSMVQVFRTGTFYHPLYGRFTITPETLRLMQDNFRRVRPKSPTEMPVDYEHMSMSSQVAPAAGWVKGVSTDGHGLFADIEWTEAAAAKIAAKEYRFISPEFLLHYTDKETGRDVGAVLLCVALTNRPFIEGMRPVMLSRELEASMALSEDAFAMSEWDAAYMNELPDGCFAYISPGGDKDGSGKTEPRSLRHLPYRGKDGAIDMPHLRNALARLEQTDIPPEAKDKARKVLEAALEDAQKKERGKGMSMTEQETKQLADVTAEVARLGAELQTANAATKVALKERDDVKGIMSLREAEGIVAKAITDRKLLPKQAEWGKALALKDRPAFDLYVSTAEQVGPPTGEKGGGREVQADVMALTEAEISIGKKVAASMRMDEASYLKALAEAKKKSAEAGN